MQSPLITHSFIAFHTSTFLDTADTSRLFRVAKPIKHSIYQTLNYAKNKNAIVNTLTGIARHSMQNISSMFGLPPHQQPVLESFMNRVMIPGLNEIYGRVYTLQELITWIEFDGTRVGRSNRIKGGQLAERIARLSMQSLIEMSHAAQTGEENKEEVNKPQMPQLSKRERVAKRLVGLFQEGMLDAQMAGFKQLLIGNAIPASRHQILLKQYQSHLNRNFIPRIINLYCETYTLNELRQLYHFQSSEMGQAHRRKEIIVAQRMGALIKEKIAAFIIQNSRPSSLMMF